MRLALLIAFLCASGTAWIYEVNVNPGHAPQSKWQLAVAAGLAAIFWVRVVYPFMGKSWLKDAILILVAFPSVGALAGLFAAFGHPFGIIPGVIVAVSMPWMFPSEIVPIYAFGICAAFALPRRNGS